MQETLSKTLTFWTFLLVPITNKEVAKTNTTFCLVGLETLIRKMLFLITIVICDFAPVFVIFFNWPVPIILSKKIG